MGAASALGRDEGGVRKPAVSSVVQPFCWTETAPPPDGPRSEGRLRVRRLSRGSSRFSARASVPVKTPRVEDARHDDAGTGTRGRECVINQRPDGGQGSKNDKLPVKTTGPQPKDHFYFGFSWLAVFLFFCE